MRDFRLKIYKIWLSELPVFNVIWRHLVTVPLFFIYFLIFKHFFLLFGRVLVESTRKPVYSDWTRSSIIQNCFNLPGGYIPQKYIENLSSNKKRLIWLKRTKPEYWEINENRRLEKTALGQTRDFSDEETCDRSHQSYRIDTCSACSCNFKVQHFSTLSHIFLCDMSQISFYNKKTFLYKC